MSDKDKKYTSDGATGDNQAEQLFGLVGRKVLLIDLSPNWSVLVQISWFGNCDCETFGES